MNVKRVYELRRAGYHDEALVGAENLFAAKPDKFNAAALFWCLGDVFKKETDQDARSALFERMKSLAEDFCQGDAHVSNALNAMSRQLDPIALKLKEALEAAKNGVLTEAVVGECRTLFENGSLDKNLYRDFGWLIYRNLKIMSPNEATKRKRLLHYYLQLGLPAPDLLHSLILSEAVKVEKNTPLQFRIRDFMNIWGWSNIRDDDWTQFQAESGHTATSLVEKLISVYAKELRTDGVPAPDEFNALIDRALERYPDSQNLPLHKARALMSLGKDDEAFGFFKRLLLKTPSKYYLWNQASLLTDDIDLRIALLCKAIAVERNESYIGGCRLNLAKALVAKGLSGNAKHEIDRYREFYTQQGWGLKPEFWEVERLIPHGTQPVDNAALFAAFVPRAEEFIYSELPSRLAIKVEDRLVEDKGRPGHKFTQWTLRTKDGNVWLRKPAKFGLDNRTKNGSAFDIKLYNGRIVWIKPTSLGPAAHDWVKILEGTVRIRTDKNGHAYTLIGGAYVGEKLLKGIAEGQPVNVLAILKDDGRWSAVALEAR